MSNTPSYRPQTSTGGPDLINKVNYSTPTNAGQQPGQSSPTTGFGSPTSTSSNSGPNLTSNNYGPNLSGNNYGPNLTNNYGPNLSGGYGPNLSGNYGPNLSGGSTPKTSYGPNLSGVNYGPNLSGSITPKTNSGFIPVYSHAPEHLNRASPFTKEDSNTPKTTSGSTPVYSQTPQNLNKTSPFSKEESKTQISSKPSSNAGKGGLPFGIGFGSVEALVPGYRPTPNANLKADPLLVKQQELAKPNPYTELMKQLKPGQKFKDTEFPPELKSLDGGLSDQEIKAMGVPLNFKAFGWLRAEEIYGKGNFDIFKAGIEPNDIFQGKLGDCYFLCTLAALAEWPNRIKKLFEAEHINENGCYAVKICDMGIWQTVIVDDFFPVDQATRQPVFSRSNVGELWVLLLEKAWAKVYGSYVKVDAGLTRECLHDLTGAPTKTYFTDEKDKIEEIWAKISEGEEKHFVMTACSADLCNGLDVMGNLGLVGSHAYSLLAARTVKDSQGKVIRLVQLRNPWGKGEWKGDWSDNSLKWTEDLKKQVKLEQKNDGIFYMAYDDLLKYYSDLQICKVHDNFVYTAVKSACLKRHASYFKLTVKTRGRYYITVNQESVRKHLAKENYQYGEVSLVLARKVGSKYEYVEGYHRPDKEVWTDGDLLEGEYYAYVKIIWKSGKIGEFSLSAYGPGEVNIEKVEKKTCPDFIEKTYLSKGRMSSHLEDYSKHGVGNCFRVLEITDDGFGYIYYKNLSNKHLEEELHFKGLEGLKLKKPYRGQAYKIKVPAHEERVVILKVLPNIRRMNHTFFDKVKFTGK